MIPALERFVVGVPVQAIHNALKPSSIDGFKQMPKNAIAKPHARSFCVSTTRKDRFASVRPSMHRDIVNHSPDSPAQERGEGDLTPVPTPRRSEAGTQTYSASSRPACNSRKGR